MKEESKNVNNIPPHSVGFIAGPSGIGKGYGVGQVLSEYFGVKVFVTGDHCRTYMIEHSGNGHLVNDELIYKWVEHDFKLNHDHHYLIDAPRSIPQAEHFIKMFRSFNPLCQIVTIHICGEREKCEHLIADRALRQERPDDACPEAINRRLNTYFGDRKGQKGLLHTLIPYLKFHTVYHPIDGNKPIEDTRIFVREILGPYLYHSPQEKEVRNQDLLEIPVVG